MEKTTDIFYALNMMENGDQTTELYSRLDLIKDTNRDLMYRYLYGVRCEVVCEVVCEVLKMSCNEAYYIKEDLLII